MTTQQEVIDAFVNFETSPRCASNFKMVTVGGGLKAFLVGGNEAVYAARRPINQIQLYRDWRTPRTLINYNLTRNGVRRQAYRVCRNIDPDSYRCAVPDDVTVEIIQRDGLPDDRIRPSTDDFDALA